MTAARRDGFSLLEVLMATSILLGSVIVLNQLAGIGRKNAVAAQDLATAQMLCQTKINEILAGTSKAEAVEDEPLPGAPGWVYTLNVDPVDPSATIEQAKFSLLELTVARAESEPTSSSRFTLVRWIDSASVDDRDGNTAPRAVSAAKTGAVGGL